MTYQIHEYIAAFVEALVPEKYRNNVADEIYTALADGSESKYLNTAARDIVAAHAAQSEPALTWREVQN